MSVEEVGLEYLKNLYKKKCHDIGISEKKIGKYFVKNI